MNLTRKRYDELLEQARQRGFEAGRQVAVVQEEAKLRLAVQAHNLQIHHLHGAAMLVKTLHEQLGLAGVPEWNPRRE